MQTKTNEISWSDSDILNLDEWIPEGEPNAELSRPFLLHDAGFILAVVFARDFDESLDIAATAGKLDRFAVSESGRADYDADHEFAYFNAQGEPLDVDNVEFVELPNVPRSFVAQFVAGVANAS